MTGSYCCFSERSREAQSYGTGKKASTANEKAVYSDEILDADQLLSLIETPLTTPDHPCDSSDMGVV